MPKNNVPSSAFRHPIQLLAIGFGSGAAPTAPGTWGSAVAIIPYLLLAPLDASYYALAVFMATLVGIYICGATARQWQVHDHPGIVWDEFVGIWITFFLVPVTWYWLVLGFALFRLFDIWKPWIIGYADKRLDGGLGIMMDDVLAGLFAWAALQAIILGSAFLLHGI